MKVKVVKTKTAGSKIITSKQPAKKPTPFDELKSINSTITYDGMGLNRQDLEELTIKVVNDVERKFTRLYDITKSMSDKELSDYGDDVSIERYILLERIIDNPNYSRAISHLKTRIRNASNFTEDNFYVVLGINISYDTDDYDVYIKYGVNLIYKSDESDNITYTGIYHTFDDFVDTIDIAKRVITDSPVEKIMAAYDGWRAFNNMMKNNMLQGTIDTLVYWWDN